VKKPRRYLALHLPKLATDRIRHREPDLAEMRIATWATVGNRRLLTCVHAAGTTLHTGQALADAQAMYPDLTLRPADPVADAAFLERLALWAMRYTPLVSVNPPDGLVLDVTGCAELVGGEEALLQGAASSLRRGGIAVAAVLASGADAAGTLARAGHHGAVIPPGKENGAAAGLAIAELRLGGDVVSGLHRLGLQTVGDLLRQPRAPLARRFGRPLMDILDSLTGERPRSLPPVRPPPLFIETLAFLEPIVTRPAIDRALDALLDPLCQALVAAGQGARKVTLQAYRVDRDVQEITVGTGLPTRTPKHLRRLFANELERLEPDLGFERITLGAIVTDDMAGEQNSIATTGGFGDASRREALAQLLDRLSQRLPVWRLSARQSHWPERAAVPVGPFEKVTPFQRRVGQPVLMLKRPVPVMVVAAVPDGPPHQVRLHGSVQAVVSCDGPERIEREWWRDDASGSRDYYRVQLQSGSRLWIGRKAALRPDRPDRWFLHGYMA
jgi:protein ImuB